MGLLLAGLTLWLIVTLVRTVWLWMTAHWYIQVLAFIGLGGAAVVAVNRRRQAARVRQERLRALRYTIEEIDAMTPTQFEVASSMLLRRDGLHADHVGGSNDQAADVIARDRIGRVIVVQCKHTVRSAKVTAPVLYAVNGTARPTHGAHVVVVVTNGGFTANARDWAPRHGIHLIDRALLARWANEGDSLEHLLGLRSST